MPIIEFTKRDILRGTVVEPAWYRVHIDNVGQKPSNDAKSTNYPVEAYVLFNADTGDTKYADVPLDNWQFNSKAIGMAKSFLEAFDVKVEAGVRIDLNGAAGKDLDVFIGNKTYDNRIMNDVTVQCRKPNPAVKAVVNVT